MEASQVQPQPRKKPRFFYGWVVLIVGGVCNAMSWGAGGASFSVFLRPMSESLGWNRTTLTGAGYYTEHLKPHSHAHRWPFHR